jgi:hypothetical protein
MKWLKILKQSWIKKIRSQATVGMKKQAATGAWQ